ncbi:hypothetical protein SDC9_51896 [bioreactor metagenome]|uniref:Type I restriction enzyme R protein N-terminal domain-containing protein n=1 Tax=bioreactor metagenome TaxID=1076179 RepID=A0A644WNX8_9ZZZZ
MNKEKWNEICFLLFDSIRFDISENDFEKNIVQALRVLDWKMYSGDIEIRSSIPIGAVNKITPDFVIKSSGNKKLFVIEIKQPSIPLTSKFQQQLFSYMRQLKLEYGILIGQEIQIFYDGDLSNQEDPILLETINFTKDNEKGLKFVELFAKGSFNRESLKSYTISALKKINRREEHKFLTKKLLSESYQNKIRELIKQDFLNEYDGELIDAVLKEVKIEIKQKNTEQNLRELPKNQLNQQGNIDHSPATLPIELNPSSESEFKRRLLSTKKAYITTFYNNGTTKQKVWNALRFGEDSNVLGNLRSRSEFRNGEWQKLGIEKVYVSIDK